MAQHLPREDSVDNLLYLCYTDAFFENPELYALMKNALLETPGGADPGREAHRSCAHRPRCDVGERRRIQRRGHRIHNCDALRGRTVDRVRIRLAILAALA